MSYDKQPTGQTARDLLELAVGYVHGGSCGEGDKEASQLSDKIHAYLAQLSPSISGEVTDAEIHTVYKDMGQPVTIATTRYALTRFLNNRP